MIKLVVAITFGLLTLMFFRLCVVFLRRRIILARLAGRLKTRFSKRDNLNLLDRLAHSYFLQTGHSPLAYNVIHGRYNDTQIVIFDYRMETGNGFQRVIHNHTMVVCFYGCSFPSLLVLEENSFKPLAAYRFYTLLSGNESPLNSKFRFYTDQGQEESQLLTNPVHRVLEKFGAVECEFCENRLIFKAPKLLPWADMVRLVKCATHCGKTITTNLCHTGYSQADHKRRNLGLGRHTGN